jgi:hypothetical protein
MNKAILNRPINIILMITGITFITLTIVLNIFIIVNVTLFKSMRSFTNVQFLSIAVADTVLCLVTMPGLLLTTIYSYWPLGERMCNIWFMVDFICSNISILTLAYISYYRLQCIRKPFSAPKNNASIWQSLFPIIIIWSSVVLFWVTLLIVLKRRSDDKHDCFQTYKFEYVIFADIGAYLVPGVVLIVLQLVIYVSLNRKRDKFVKPNLLVVFNNSKLQDKIKENNIANSNYPKSQNQSSFSIDEKDIIKVVKVLDKRFHDDELENSGAFRIEDLNSTDFEEIICENLNSKIEKLESYPIQENNVLNTSTNNTFKSFMVPKLKISESIEDMNIHLNTNEANETSSSGKIKVPNGNNLI